MDRALTGTKGREALWKDLDSGAITVRWWADAMDETLRIARHQLGQACHTLGLKKPKELLHTVCLCAVVEAMLEVSHCPVDER